MNKTYIAIGVLILVILGAGIFVYSSNMKKDDSAMMAKDESMQSSSDQSTEDSQMMDKDDSMMQSGSDNTDSMTNSSYVAFSQNSLNETTTDRKVLFFYASWCPTCRPADEDFQANSSSFPEDLTVIRVNYNDPETEQTERDLAKKYNVTYQHTFVQIDKNGNEVTKWNGGQTEELLANIK